MEIDISTRHGQLSADSQERITAKVGKLPRFFDRVTAVRVVVDLEHKEQQQVELRVSAEHSNDFVASVEASSVMAALDGAMHKIEQQLRKHKEKLTGHRGGGHKHSPPENDDADD